jgi:SAM-dependent methyltransferase/uncharacterized protein YbaR (Trm112 family)
MNLELLEILCCPFCGGRLQLQSDSILEVQEEEEVRSGILFCQCCAYPIVSGIPYLRAGKGAQRAIDLLGKGQSDAALAALLGLTLEEAEFRRLLDDEQFTFRRALEYLCRDAEATYLLYRFSDPTYLSSRALLQGIGQDRRCIASRVLDVCGGTGHLTRTLCEVAGPGRVVLADISFWKLWLARRFLAPDCQPVCCDANEPLPFARDSFSLVACTDAFHYIWRKRLLAEEMTRLVGEDGVVVLAHLHNSLCDNPSAGMPLTPAGYRNLFDGMAPRLFPERPWLDIALTHTSGDLSVVKPDGEPDDALTDEPSLVLIATRLPGRLQASAPAEALTLGTGVMVNPLYTVREDRKVTLELQFPSPEYELEFGDCRRYLPERVELDADALEGSRVTKLDASMKRLVEQCVLLDLPAGYL